MFGPDRDELSVFHSQRNVKDNVCLHRILLIGGSTAANFPVRLLEEAFVKKFPDQQFEVTNMATGGYNARQELITVALWGISVKPDIIISLDGANDLIHRLRMKKAGTFYLNTTYELFLKNPLFAPIGNIFAKSQLIQGLFRLRERLQLETADKYKDAIPVYISAQHGMNIFARGLCATRIMVLQPFMSFKEPLSSAEANFGHYKYRENVIKELYGLMGEELATLAVEDSVLYVDSRFIFKGMPETIFSDDVHFINDGGYRLLAQSIADAVNRKDLENKCIN